MYSCRAAATSGGGAPAQEPVPEPRRRHSSREGEALRAVEHRDAQPLLQHLVARVVRHLPPPLVSRPLRPPFRSDTSPLSAPIHQPCPAMAASTGAILSPAESDTARPAPVASAWPARLAAGRRGSVPQVSREAPGRAAAGPWRPRGDPSSRRRGLRPPQRPEGAYTERPAAQPAAAAAAGSKQRRRPSRPGGHLRRLKLLGGAWAVRGAITTEEAADGDLEQVATVITCYRR